MFEVGDIVKIVPTKDDAMSQDIAGSIARIVEKEAITINSYQLYAISFIDLKVAKTVSPNERHYARATKHWASKNLCYASELKDVSESDIMNLLSGE